MHTTRLRKVGGSIMLAIPPVILDMLELHERDEVGLSVDDGRIIVIRTPSVRPRYTLAELLAQCDPDAPLPQDVDPEVREWLDSPPVGREEL